MESETVARIAQPQADGDSRPLHRWDLGSMPNGPVRVHVEKSGPAFYRGRQFAAQPTVDDMLVQSLQSQAIGAAGLVLNAMSRPRQCFLDVMPAWTRLLKIAGVELPVYRTSPRQSWEWDEMREAVVLALCYAEQIDTPAGLVKWGTADALLRGYARDAAASIESRLDMSDPNLTMLSINVGKYRAFAEGRA